MDTEEVSFIYIMGRGHSGTTILDAMLGNGYNMHSIGEIVSGMPRTEDICSCGSQIKDCDFWNTVKSKFENKSKYSWEEAAKRIQSQAHLKSFFSTLLGIRKKRIFELKQINKNLLESIKEVSKKDLLIDSSKEFTRGLFLTKYFSKVKVIHLVRNPLKILSSNMLRIKEGKFKFLRYSFEAKTVTPFIILSSLGWLIGNLIGEFISFLFKEKVMRVRYEDLCKNPESELRRIEKFVDCNLTNVRKKVSESKKMNIKHMIAGNRIRQKGEFIFKPSRSEGRGLSKKFKSLGLLFTWPLMYKYDYVAKD